MIAPATAPPCMIGATHSRCSSGATPDSCTSTSATHLNISASSAWLSDCGSGIAAPMALARVSNSMPMPSQSTVCSCRYQAKPSTPTCVMLPPKQPLRSMSAVLTPARAAASAAASPPVRYRPPARRFRARRRATGRLSDGRHGESSLFTVRESYNGALIAGGKYRLLTACPRIISGYCMHIKVTRLTRAIGAVIEGVDLSADLH